MTTICSEETEAQKNPELHSSGLFEGLEPKSLTFAQAPVASQSVAHEACLFV